MDMKPRNIPFSPPDMSEAEVQEVAEALRSGWITTGPRTKEFERQIAAYCGTTKAVCLSSATACMESILRACMEQVFSLAVPLVAEVKTGESWYETK